MLIIAGRGPLALFRHLAQQLARAPLGAQALLGRLVDQQQRLPGVDRALDGASTIPPGAS
jgi:hypothetical protein